MLPLRVALLAAGQPWIAEFCRRAMLLNFAEDRDIDSLPAMRGLLDDMGLPAEAPIGAASVSPAA